MLWPLDRACRRLPGVLESCVRFAAGNLRVGPFELLDDPYDVAPRFCAAERLEPPTLATKDEEHAPRSAVRARDIVKRGTPRAKQGRLCQFLEHHLQEHGERRRGDTGHSYGIGCRKVRARLGEKGVGPFAIGGHGYAIF